MSEMKKVFHDQKFIMFLKNHENELINIAIWAAFGFKNNAERDAVKLLHEFNESRHD